MISVTCEQTSKEWKQIVFHGKEEKKNNKPSQLALQEPHSTAK